MTNCKAITDYIKLVESGKYRVCNDQNLLIKHIKNCFENESIYVDEEQLNKYFSYQKYFDYELFEWEKFCFALHNCTYSSPGILRWPDLVMVVGRGSGKNGYLSFEDFCLLTPTNGIKTYHIDLCANSEDQAKTTFEDVYNVLENNKKKMSKFFKWNLEKITNLQTGSTLRFRTSSSKSADGGRPGKVDFDEYHEYENSKLIDVFTTGLGKKPQPRTTITTTLGKVRDGPLDNLMKDLTAILNGIIPDNGTIPFICRLDNDEEVHDEANWYKANPSLQYFPNLLVEMRKEYKKYLRDKISNASFMIKRMNRIVTDNTACVTEWKNILATNRDIIDLSKYPAVFGIDYTKVTDFLVAGLLFKVEDTLYWLSHTWVCKNSNDLSRIRFPLDEQVQRGELTFVDDVEISPEIVVNWLAEMSKKYRIVGGAVDTFRYSLLKGPLKDAGFDGEKKGKNNLKLVRLPDITRIAPSISSCFVRKKVVFGDSPLMRWYTNNTKVTSDKYSNLVYGKIEPKSRKTDGFMAFAMANTQIELLEKNKPISTKAKKLINQVYTY